MQEKQLDQEYFEQITSQNLKNIPGLINSANQKNLISQESKQNRDKISQEDQSYQNFSNTSESSIDSFQALNQIIEDINHELQNGSKQQRMKNISKYQNLKQNPSQKIYPNEFYGKKDVYGADLEQVHEQNTEQFCQMLNSNKGQIKLGKKQHVYKIIGSLLFILFLVSIGIIIIKNVLNKDLLKGNINNLECFHNSKKEKNNDNGMNKNVNLNINNKNNKILMPQQWLQFEIDQGQNCLLLAYMLLITFIATICLLIEQIIQSICSYKELKYYQKSIAISNS